MANNNIREEEVKNRLRQDFFQDYDATPVLGDINFAVTTKRTDKAQTEQLFDRDQFLYPNNGWEADVEFQSDSLAYTLFTNNIQSQYGPNHWLPFTEAEVGARDVFQSHFMHDYITGKHQPQEKAQPVEQSLFGTHPSHPEGRETGIVFSPEATAVMDAARELWRYYHRQPGANPNASYYDIRLHFQGTKISKSGKVQMNADSADEHYNCLVKALRQAVRALAQKIEPKVYEYGFLKA